MKVAEDFFLLLHAHIVSTARVLLSCGIPASVSILAKTIVGTFLKVSLLSNDKSNTVSCAGDVEDGCSHVCK